MSFAVISPPDGPPSKPLPGRAHELRWLIAGLRTAQRGAGALVVVDGMPGMGKSCLLRAARRRARAMEMTVLATRALDDERARSRAVVGRLCAAAGGEPDTTVQALVRLVRKLAAQRPVLVAVDDVDRCDGQSLCALAALAVALDDVGGVALVVAHRSGTPRCVDRGALGDVVRDAGAIRIRLGPLDAPDAATILEAGAGAAPEPEFAAAAHRLTAGNPSFLRELALALGERGIPPLEAHVAELSDLAIPEVARGVRERAGDARVIIDALAVLGDEATLAETAAVADSSHGDIADRCAELVGAGVLLEADPPRFSAPLVRPSVYATIAPGERLRLHGRAARALAAAGAAIDTVACHLVAAAPTQDEWAARTLRAAAGSARARGALADACTYLRRAVREDASGLEPELARDLGLTLAALGDPAAAEHLRRAYDLSGCARVRGELGLALARVSAATGEVASARQWCVAARDQLPGSSDHRLSARLDAELGALGAPGHDLWVELPPGWVTAGSDPSGCLGLALHADLATRAGGPREDAVELARRALSGARVWSERGSLVPHLAVEALVAAEHLEEARTHWDAGLAGHERAGALWDVAAIRAHRAGTLLRLGALDDAIVDARAALEAVGDTPGPLRARASASLAEALLEEGQLDAAATVLDDVRGREEASDALTLLASARVNIAHRRYADALSELGRVAESALDNPALAPWRSLAAECHVALGARDDARELAAEELELARGYGAPAAQARALRALALALVADGEAALAALRQAARLLDGSPCRLDRARTLLALGTALSSAGKAGHARDCLRDAMAIAYACGASVLATGSRDALVAAGARPRRPIHRGRDSLTRAERSVAELAAAGHTNREIGRELYITLNTVATHLRSVYRKLNISSRAQLPAQLAAG